MLRSHLSCHATALLRLNNVGNNVSIASLVRGIPASRSISTNGFHHPSRPALQVRPWENVNVISAHSYATKAKHSKKNKHAADKSSYVPAYVDTLVELRDAIAEADVKSILSAYLSIRDTLRLGGDDVASISQALCSALRRHHPKSKNDQVPAELVALADLLVADIGAHHLPPSHTAHLNLITFYKDAAQSEKGANFWNWLESQDESFVSPAVYGAAIELLAVQGRPGEETERLYQQALKRFPGSFNEYHLSPDAILPDRSQPFNVKGIPIALLQGITTARVLRGDIQSAYLALDTAFRLFPTHLPARLFTLFVQERPVTESYKVFLMACRSGIIPGPECLKILLTKLRRVAVMDPLANASVLRSLLTASYAYAAIGSSLTSSHLTEIVIAITSIMQHPSTRALSKPDAKRLSNQILLTIRGLFDIWKTQRSLPGLVAFNSIIANLGGRAEGNEITTVCLADIRALGIQPTDVTYRSLLRAAGQIGNYDSMISTWEDLVAFRKTVGKPLQLADWQGLVAAAKEMGKEDFVREQLDIFGTELNPHLVSRVSGLLDVKAREPTLGHENVTADQVQGLIEDFARDIAFMEDQLQANAMPDFYANPLPMSLVSSVPLSDAEEEELRAVYDELTTDNSYNTVQHQIQQPDEQVSEIEQEVSDLLPEVPVEVKPAMSSTGFEYGALRYQNWRTINELLAESAENDSNYMAAVDAAIQTGGQLPKRGDGWKQPDNLGPSWGLSNLEAYQKTTHSENHDDDIREKVFRLRGKLDRV